ncbi:ATP-binding protein [Telmatospirillum sp. J64-1]|uniref:cache domain-containing sensor histidine kinase n=1 Tax=Telmatospirillum sp. J64-1 TaxID=2502183 RepID=UPI00115E29F1|nr:ATP-binding protein [Telmatospirillum sp. J64-1]
MASRKETFWTAIRPSWGVWGAVLLLTLIGAFFWSAAIITDYRESLLRARAVAADTALLLDEHMRRVVEVTDLILEQEADYLATTELDYPISTSYSAWLRLRERARPLPQVGSLWLIDAKGVVLLGTLRFPIARLEVSDRDYFRLHAQGLASHLGPSLEGRATGARGFTISRRISGPDGSFKGVILAYLPPPLLGEIATLGRGMNTRLAVYRTDGSVIFESPESEQGGHSIAGSALLHDHLPTGLSGTYQETSSRTAGESIISWRHLHDLGLVVVAEIDADLVMAEWRNRFYRNLLLAGLGMTAVLGLAFLTTRGLRRERAAQRALALSHEALAQRSHALNDANLLLTAANMEAQRAQEAKSRFLAAASHDLRQPLQATRLFLDVLMLRQKDEKLREVTERAVEALEGANSLLNTLLDVSTLEAGIVKPEIRDLPVNQILIALARDCAPEAMAVGLRLSMVPCSAVVRSDPVLLQRMVRNLVVNAIRYTGEGRILLGCRRRGDRLSIEVWDTGPGIPEDRLNLIFEDFYQIGNPERDRRKGLGLGLSIVQRTGELLGHRIWVRSRLGKGSAFGVVVPVVGEAPLFSAVIPQHEAALD